VIVGIDTMVLIWALPEPHIKGKKPPSTQDVAEMQRRAKFLLETLAEENADVVVPTITVSEWLTGIDPSKQGTFISELQESFTLAAFNPKAAAIAAKLFQDVQNLPAEDKPQRKCMKADMMIVATAKAADAVRFFSHEPRVRKYVELVGMEAKDLPKTGTNLFSGVPNPDPKKKPQ